jgi:hypothetical protein
MSKTISYIFSVVLLAELTGFVSACGDKDTGKEGECTDCEDDAGIDGGAVDTGTGTGEDELPPIRYEDDQYGNPEAGCDPQPEEIALTAELTDEGEGAWVGQCENRFGLQGAWFAYDDNEDGGISEITMDYSEAPSGKVCASGVGGQVWYDDYAKYWGAGFGVNICTTGEEDARVVDTLGECTLFDPRTKIIGFRVTVEGDQIPAGPAGADPQLRVQFAEEDRAESTYLVVDAAGGTADYMFEDAVVKYAVDRGDTDVEPIHVDKIIALQFQVSTTAEGDTPFSFCVSDIMPILE